MKYLLQKRYYIPFVAVLLLTAIILSLILPSRITIAGQGTISFLTTETGVSADISDYYDAPNNRHYYLCGIKGGGTYRDPFKPVVAGTGYKWGMVRLAPDKCLAYADTKTILSGGNIQYLCDNPFDVLTIASKSVLNQSLSVSIQKDNLSEYLFEYLTVSQKDGLTKEIDGNYRIYLGGQQIYGEAPAELSHGTITDNMSPQHTWTEPDGTAWVFDGTAHNAGERNEMTYISDYAMTSADHYNQVVLKSLVQTAGSATYLYVLARYNGESLASGNFRLYALIASSEAGNEYYQLAVMSDSGFSIIDTDTQDPDVNDIMYISCDGSTITGKVDGVTLVSASNSELAAGSRVGLWYGGYDPSDSASCDDLEASELFTADISNTPSSKAFGVVADNTTYYAYGSAPSNPVTDGQCTFTITNNGDTAKINIKGSNATGGTGWTLVATAPSTNQYRLTCYASGTNPASGIVLTTSDQQFIASLAASGTKKWDFKLETGFSTDGVEKSGTITLTAVAP